MELYNEDEAGEFSAIQWVDLDTDELTGWHLVRGDENESLCGEMINQGELEFSNDLFLVDCLECNEAMGNANN